MRRVSVYGVFDFVNNKRRIRRAMCSVTRNVPADFPDRIPQPLSVFPVLAGEYRPLDDATRATERPRGFKLHSTAAILPRRDPTYEKRSENFIRWARKSRKRFGVTFFRLPEPPSVP